MTPLPGPGATGRDWVFSSVTVIRFVLHLCSAVPGSCLLPGDISVHIHVHGQGPFVTIILGSICFTSHLYLRAVTSQLNKKQTLPVLFPVFFLSLSRPFVSITPSKPLPRGIALAWYGLSGQELRFYNTHSPQKTTLALLPWQGQEETKDSPVCSFCSLDADNQQLLNPQSP